MRKPHALDPETQNNWPAEYVEANPIADGQSYWATGLGKVAQNIVRSVNIRRRPPSRFTQMTGGRRSRTFSIHHERGAAERDWNQGSRLGTEPYQMMKRKMKNFNSVEDAEAFALHAGWNIKSSNPSNMRFNPRIGSNRREWKNRYEFSKDGYFTKETGVGALFPYDPHSHGSRGSPGATAKTAQVSRRSAVQE